MFLFLQTIELSWKSALALSTRCVYRAVCNRIHHFSMAAAMCAAHAQ